jgi:hypothetical protein
MKPKNFPERKRQRQLRAGSPNASPVSLRDVRTKKPLKGGSPARQARHAGKLVRR